MKKIVLTGVLMLVAGVGLGMAIAQFELSRFVPRFGDDEYPVARQSTGAVTQGPLVQVVNGSDYDFGVMERNGTRNHRFEIKNTGDAPLTLQKGETTCKCTINKLVDGILQPGESVNVELEWIAKEVGPDQVFMQTADIKTNDPSRKVLRLTVRGDIITTVKVVPPVLVMSSIPSSQGAEGEVMIYSYRTDDLEFVGKPGKDPKLKDLIDAVVEPLTEKELAEDKRALSGKRLKIFLKPGLPLGALDQTVWLKTNLEDSPLVPVHFQGQVVGDISIYGRNYNRATNYLSLGKVSATEGYQGELRILVRGPHRETVQFEVESVDPADVLVAKLRSQETEGAGKAAQHFLTVSLPKGTDPVRRSAVGGGKPGQIILRTTHPEDKQLVITVDFEITE